MGSELFAQFKESTLLLPFMANSKACYTYRPNAHPHHRRPSKSEGDGASPSVDVSYSLLQLPFGSTWDAYCA